MIREVTGDILLTKAEAIAHGISPNDHFDSGLALSLREKWPEMAKAYRHYAHQVHPKPGEIWSWRDGHSTRILNLLTQEGEFTSGAKPGKASLPNVNHALKRLRHLIDQEGIQSVALPRLATGVGGLEWKPVRELIDQHLGDLAIPVLLYTTFHKGERGE